MKKRLVLMFIIICLLALTAGSNAANKNKVYFGLFRQGAPKDMSLIKDFEKTYKLKPTQIMWYLDWSCSFPGQDCDKVYEYGAVPHIVWEPWYWANPDAIKLKDIYKKKKDKYIRTWAKAVKEWGKPIFIRFAHEFNIEAYPWTINKNKKDPGRYIKAFRYVHGVFLEEGATNVRWVWCPMNYSYPEEKWNDYMKAYPGDEYVDWIGIDGYNWGTIKDWSKWESFGDLFLESVTRLSRKFPTKPIMIAEFSSSEKGGNKAEWIKDIPAYLKTNLRNIKSIIWFDIKKEADWRVNSCTKTQQAFKRIAKDLVFGGSAHDLVNLVVDYTPSSHTKKISIRKARRPININAKLTEKDWKRASKINLRSQDNVKSGARWKGPFDLSGVFYLLWDNNFLYIAAKVIDDHPINNPKTRQDIWNGDAIEFTIGTNPESNPLRTAFDKTDFQVGLSVGDGKMVKPSIWVWQNHSSPRKSKIAVRKFGKGKGHVIEARIPFEELSKFKPLPNTEYGFDIALDDSDGTGRDVQMIWNGDYLFYKDPSVWGRAVFLE